MLQEVSWDRHQLPRVSATGGTDSACSSTAGYDAIIAAIFFDNHCFPRQEIGEDMNNPLFPTSPNDLSQYFCMLGFAEKSGKYHGNVLVSALDLRMKSADPCFTELHLSLKYLTFKRHNRAVESPSNSFTLLFKGCLKMTELHPSTVIYFLPLLRALCLWFNAKGKQVPFRISILHVVA